MPLGILALLESGCGEVWLNENRTLVGIEAGDSEHQVEACRLYHKPVRVFRYGVHQDRHQQEVFRLHSLRP